MAGLFAGFWGEEASSWSGTDLRLDWRLVIYLHTPTYFPTTRLLRCLGVLTGRTWSRESQVDMVCVLRSVPLGFMGSVALHQTAKPLVFILGPALGLAGGLTGEPYPPPRNKDRHKNSQQVSVCV